MVKENSPLVCLVNKQLLLVDRRKLESDEIRAGIALSDIPGCLHFGMSTGTARDLYG